MKLFNSILIVFILVFVGCNKPPEACIELESSTASVGVPFRISSCSKHALSFEWFMQGPVGAPENVKGWSDEIFDVTFSVPGTYTIDLTAYSKFSWTGQESEATTTLTVN